MARSISAVLRNITSWFTFITPYFYKFLYYFSMPSIIVLGKFITILNALGLMSKPRSPIVEAAIDYFTGNESAQMGGYGA